MTILITGAHGTIGARVLALLTDAGLDVRAASSHPGDGEVAVDLHDPLTFAPALRGVDQVFLYANAETADAFATAAATAGVGHIVLLSSNSVTDAASNTGAMAAPFRNTETALNAGPVPVTVLRPGAFNGNAGQWSHGIRAGRGVYLPYPNARVDAVDERDIAEVAYRVLTRDTPRQQALNLTGPTAISLAEQVDALAAALGKEIQINRITRQEWKAAVHGHLTEEYADALLDYWENLAVHPAPVTTTVADITGRPATTFQQWAQDNIGQYR